MRRFQRGNDALRTCKDTCRLQRVFVADSSVFHTSMAEERGVLRSDGRIIEAGRNRMSVRNQAVVGLQDVRIGAVQNAGFAARKSRCVFAQAATSPASLDADHFHFAVGNKIVEQPDGVATATYVSEKIVRKLSGSLENLTACLLTDHAV